MGINMYKICNTCTKEKSFADFSRSKSKRDGYQTQCKDCVKEYQEANKERIIAYMQEYRETHKDNLAEYRKINKDYIANQQHKYWKEYCKNNKTQIAIQQRKYKEANKEQIAIEQRKYKEANKEQIAAYMKEYQKANKDIINAITSRRRAAKLKAMPKWLTQQDHAEIREFYKIAQWMTIAFEEPFHVDHIVPLQGTNVCGLHVPWNLQVIFARDNISKSNKFEDEN